MKERKLNFKTIMIILAVAGLLLLCAGTIMGGSLYAIPATFHETATVADSIDIKSAKTSDITGVNLNLRNSSISFKTGRIFDVSGTGNCSSYIKDGILNIGSDDNITYSLSIFGIDLKVPSSWICGYGSYVVTIPTNAKLSSININTSSCNITADSLIAENVNVEMKYGKLTANNVQANDLKTTITKGACSIANPVISNSATVDCNGYTALGASPVANCSINNLNLVTSYGKINIQSKLTGSNKISSKYGSVDMLLSGAKNNYSISSNKSDNLTIADTSNDSSEQIGTIQFDCAHGKQVVNFEE